MTFLPRITLRKHCGTEPDRHHCWGSRGHCAVVECRRGDDVRLECRGGARQVHGHDYSREAPAASLGGLRPGHGNRGHQVRTESACRSSADQRRPPNLDRVQRRAAQGCRGAGPGHSRHPAGCERALGAGQGPSGAPGGTGSQTEASRCSRRKTNPRPSWGLLDVGISQIAVVCHSFSSGPLGH